MTANDDSGGAGTGGANPVVILVRPQMGENIGAAARAMLNFGLSEMRLVAPRDGWPNPRAVAMASGAAGRVLDRARVFDSLAEARRRLALWRYDYNHVRPHSSLGGMAPAEARRALEQSVSSASGALAQPETDQYQAQGLSLSIGAQIWV